MYFMNKDKIYDLLFWSSMGVIIIWMILKATGVINTPVFVQLIPYAGGIFAFGVFFEMMRDFKNEIKSIKEDTKELRRTDQSLVSDVSQIKFRMEKVEGRLDQVENKINSVESILGKIRKTIS